MTAEIHDSLYPAGRYCLGMATTTSETSTGLRGRFWLQGNSEGEGTPGRLFLVAGSHPLLELDELLTPLTRETGRRKLPDGTELVTSSLIPPQELARQSLTIHGALETGELVTLPSAFTAGWTERGTGYKSHRLQAFYALLGDHVHGAEALFTRVRVRIRHLDAWANLPGFTLTPDLAAGKYTLAFEKPEVPPATLASGGRVAIEQVTGWEGPGVSGGKLERQVWLDVLDVPPATYRDIERTIVKPLMNLLTLSVSAECPVVAMEVSASPDHPWLTVHPAAMKPAAAAIIPLPRILLPLGEVGLAGVATWLDSVVRLGPLPSVVARAAATRDDPLETQLLELTTAAEGLHRLILPQRKRMTDEQAKEARSKALEAIKELLDDVATPSRQPLTTSPTRAIPAASLISPSTSGKPSQESPATPRSGRSAWSAPVSASRTPLRTASSTRTTQKSPSPSSSPCGGCSPDCCCSRPASTPRRSAIASTATRATSSSWNKHEHGSQPSTTPVKAPITDSNRLSRTLRADNGPSRTY